MASGPRSRSSASRTSRQATSPDGSASADRARERTARTRGSSEALHRCRAWIRFSTRRSPARDESRSSSSSSRVPVGRNHRIAVLEMSGRRGWWRVWMDGRAVTEPVRLRQSSGRWAPIATAELERRRGVVQRLLVPIRARFGLVRRGAARGGRSFRLTVSATAPTRCATSRPHRRRRAPIARLRARASCPTRSSPRRAKRPQPVGGEFATMTAASS